MTTHTAEQPRPGDRVEITAVQSYETTWDDSLDWLIGVTGVLVTVDETGVYENTASGRLDCAPYRVRVEAGAGSDTGTLVSAAGVRRLDTADDPAGEPPASQQLTPAEIRLAQYGQRTSTWSTATYNDGAEKVLHEIAVGLKEEIDRLRAVLEEIRHLHKDSPMGPCPVCIDADDAAAGGDGLVPYPCPTARLAGAQDCDPPHVRAAVPAVVEAGE